MRSACSNWDSDWGDCGRCTYCITKSSSENSATRLERIEEKLDAILAALRTRDTE